MAIGHRVLSYIYIILSCMLLLMVGVGRSYGVICGESGTGAPQLFVKYGSVHIGKALLILK